MRLTHRLTLNESRNEFNFGLSKGNEHTENNPHNSTHQNNTNNNHGKNSPTNNSRENNSTNFTNNNNATTIRRKWCRKISFKSQAGKNECGMIKTNQDSYLIMDNILNNEEFKIFGVLDGHGKL